MTRQNKVIMTQIHENPVRCDLFFVGNWACVILLNQQGRTERVRWWVEDPLSNRESFPTKNDETQKSYNNNSVLSTFQILL
jgi:hypothetical protein